MDKPQYFSYMCPHCRAETNAAEVASALDDEILMAETARRNGRRQTPHAGPGRPTIIRCPGCDSQMSSAELREHRIGCVCRRLNELVRLNLNIRLQPKDLDPYPNFRIQKVSENEVEFQKLSSDQYLTVETRKIAEITVSSGERIAYLRLLGRVCWEDDIQRWRFKATLVGRPSGALQV
jgi:ribosomal protein L44E